MIREELMSQHRSTPERYDPTQPPYEIYKIDYELFRILFGGLSPWGKCTQAESLSARLFRVCVRIIMKVRPMKVTFHLIFCWIAHGSKSR